MSKLRALYTEYWAMAQAREKAKRGFFLLLLRSLLKRTNNATDDVVTACVVTPFLMVMEGCHGSETNINIQAAAEQLSGDGPYLQTNGLVYQFEFVVPN